MPLLKLDRLCDGLEERLGPCLRAGNHPEMTRYNYLLAAAQLAKILAPESPDPDAVGVRSQDILDGLSSGLA